MAWFRQLRLLNVDDKGGYYYKCPTEIKEGDTYVCEKQDCPFYIEWCSLTGAPLAPAAMLKKSDFVLIQYVAGLWSLAVKNYHIPGSIKTIVCCWGCWGPSWEIFVPRHYLGVPATREERWRILLEKERATPGYLEALCAMEMLNGLNETLE